MKETRMVHTVFPGETNHYGTLFGGTALAWMDQAAFVAASRHARRKVVTVHSDAVDFKRPVPLGSMVELVARVVEVIPFAPVSFSKSRQDDASLTHFPGPPPWRKPGWGGIRRTSMRVEVEMWVEPLHVEAEGGLVEGKEPYLAARGGFILVGVDEKGRPVPVPPLAKGGQ